MTRRGPVSAECSSHRTGLTKCKQCVCMVNRIMLIKKLSQNVLSMLVLEPTSDLRYNIRIDDINHTYKRYV